MKPKSMPFVIFRWGSFAVHIGDHLQFGIICGPIWDHFRSGDHLRSGIICSAVQIALWVHLGPIPLLVLKESTRQSNKMYSP